VPEQRHQRDVGAAIDATIQQVRGINAGTTSDR